MNIKQMVKKNIMDTPPSGIRKYFDLINEMKDAISLGIGEPDFETPWSIREEGIYSLEKGRPSIPPMLALLSFVKRLLTT